MSVQYWFGKWHRGGPLNAAQASRLCLQAEEKRPSVAQYPIDKVLRVLGRLRERWADPNYAPRRRVQRALPEATGFSPAMINLGLRELCWTFDPRFLERKLRTELGGQDKTGEKRWEPLGSVLHVLAGNVFVGAAGSLVEGLITGNVNLLKMSSGETVFLPELVRSLIECDEDRVLSRALAVVEYSSSQQDVIAEFKRRVDGVVVWGGEEAVRAYRDGLPARTRLIVFGPMLSLAVVTREGLREGGVAAAAERLAREVSLWDQNACTAPQLCFVQGGAAARRLAAALGAALDAAAVDLPPGAVERDQAVEIQKLRSVFEVAEARGEGRLWTSKRDLDWTVALDSDQAVEPSPLHRTLRVVPYEDLAEVETRLAGLRGYVQTVGLCAAPAEAGPLSARLAGLGALRIVELGKMGEGEIDDPHDGRYDLPQFKRLVLARARPPSYPAFAWMTHDEQRRLLGERLRGLADHARRSPFYARRLRGLRLDGPDDLKRVRILTREEMEANMPPKGLALGTGPWTGGYVSRSGGSTGEPKFSVYDGNDWEMMIAHASGVFRALGLVESDRLGNLMLAGDLYGSFVSFDHINCRLGLTTFAFAGNSKPEVFAQVWRDFRLNAVEGIPSHLIPFLREAKRVEPQLTLEKIVYAGGPLSAVDRRWLHSELGARRIASVIGANDGGLIAYQCDRQSGALHHAADDFNYLEIVDGSGRRLPDGRRGLIVITSLLKRAYPLIRYAVGDQGRIKPGRCPCGANARVLEYLGRADDILSVGMLNVSYRDLADALSALPLTNLQVAARVGDRGESLVVRAETGQPSPQLKRRVQEALLRSLAKLQERLDDGNLAGLEVELLAFGALPRNPRTGKVRALVDERA